MSYNTGVLISWQNGKMYFKPNQKFYARLWAKAHSKHPKSVSEAGESYWDHVINRASRDAFHRQEESEVLLSAEALPENSSWLGFAAFAKDYPEKFFALLEGLRPELRELCIEYYLLHKSQSWIGRAHGFIQTRAWQALRVIEQAMGAAILLGPHPSVETISEILSETDLANAHKTAGMIVCYAKSESYTCVAKMFDVPPPQVRKLFRPLVNKLLADRNVKVVAVGAYLRSLTHWASLTNTGLSKSCKARLRRVGHLRFTAPPLENVALMNFGAITKLKDQPWYMFEVSSAHRMEQLRPIIREQSKSLFGKKPAQIFAPISADGELVYGYLFARCTSQGLVRRLTHMRGISEMAGMCAEGEYLQAVTIPHVEVQKLIDTHHEAPAAPLKKGAFVRVLTGDAAHYCGVITELEDRRAIVRVTMLTDRSFTVTADRSALQVLDVPKDKQVFWGSL